MNLLSKGKVQVELKIAYKDHFRFLAITLPPSSPFYYMHEYKPTAIQKRKALVHLIKATASGTSGLSEVLIHTSTTWIAGD